MKSFIVAATLLALVSGVSPAFAAKKKHPTKTRSTKQGVETYSAEDPDPMERSASAITLPAGDAAGIAAPEGATPPSAGSVRSTLDIPPPSVSTRWQTAPFDAVPQSQADGISKRLGLVEEILRKYGRAYDYRTLTIKDLQAILADLDAQATRSVSKDAL
jgi:hypothetical protein